MQEKHAWNKRLDLGYDALDREHHLQVALVSGLADAIERGRPRMARRLLEQLTGYSRAHFAGEELLMDASRYRLLPAHRQEHHAILAEIQEIQYLFDRAEYDLAAPMALDLLAGLVSHIAASDRRFAEHAELAPAAAASAAAATASDSDHSCAARPALEGGEG